MGRDRLSAWLTGEALARIVAAQRSAREGWEPLQRLAVTHGDIDDDAFRGHVMRVAKALDALDNYFALLLVEARRRGIG